MQSGPEWITGLVMFLAAGFFAVLLLTATMRFYEATPLTMVTTLAVGGAVVVAADHVFVTMSEEERVDLLRTLHVLPPPLPDMVMLTQRCSHVVEETAGQPAGSMDSLGAPFRRTDGQGWSITWTSEGRSVQPAGDYGCSGEGSAITALLIAGETKPLAR